MQRSWYAAQTIILWCCGQMITIWLIKLKRKLKLELIYLGIIKNLFFLLRHCWTERSVRFGNYLWLNKTLERIKFPQLLWTQQRLWTQRSEMIIIWKINSNLFCLVKFAIYLAAWDNKLGQWPPSITVKKCNKTCRDRSYKSKLTSPPEWCLSMFQPHPQQYLVAFLWYQPGSCIHVKSPQF